MKLTDLLVTPMTEVSRLDYAIQENERLRRKFSSLVDLLVEKKLIANDEAVRLRTEDPS